MCTVRTMTTKLNDELNPDVSIRKKCVYCADNVPSLDTDMHSSHHGLQDLEGLWVFGQGIWVSTEKQ